MIIGPNHTPRVVKTLIWITAIVSLLSPILSYFFASNFQMLGPGAWLSLSRFGLLRGWLWQPLTYFFVHSVGGGISLSFLISLFFHLFILWFAGSEIAFRYGAKNFALFYLSAGLIGGLAATATFFTTSSFEVLFGSGPAVFALLTLWAMLYPNMNLFFLMIVKLKAKFLASIILGIALLVHLSHGEWAFFFADLAGILWALTIGRFAWKLDLPFKQSS